MLWFNERNITDWQINMSMNMFKHKNGKERNACRIYLCMSLSCGPISVLMLLSIQHSLIYWTDFNSNTIQISFIRNSIYLFVFESTSQLQIIINICKITATFSTVNIGFVVIKLAPKIIIWIL